MNKNWQSLAALFLLGLIGGILYDAGDVLLRLWSRSMGLKPKELDILNTIEILHPLKFLWAPLFSIPFVLGRWNNRRAWLLVVMILAAFAMMALCWIPFFGLYFLIFLFILTLARASYDALVIASQMDAVSKNLWGFSENSCVMGYRVGIMATSYCALCASTWGLSWTYIYASVVGMIVLGLIFVAYSPLFHFLNHVSSANQPNASERITFPNASNTSKDMKSQGLWHSLQEWMQLPGSGWVILFLLIYRLQDGLIDPQREYFLLDAGLTVMNLAHWKSIGLCGTIAGGIGAGACIRYWGYRRSLTWGLILHGTAAVLLYFASIQSCPTMALKMAYCLEQTTKGWSTIAIYSFQLMCCNGENIISQLALFSALSDMGLKIMSMRSGWLAQEYGWPFLMGTGSLCGLPALALIPFIFSKTFISEKIAKR